MLVSALEIGDMYGSIDLPEDRIRELGHPYLGLIMARAAATNHPVARFHGVDQFLKRAIKVDYYPESDPKLARERKFAMILGRTISHVINQDHKRFSAAWRQLVAAAKTDCALLTKRETAQVAEATTLSLLVMTPMIGKIPVEAYSSWNKLCQ